MHELQKWISGDKVRQLLSQQLWQSLRDVDLDEYLRVMESSVTDELQTLSLIGIVQKSCRLS